MILQNEVLIKAGSYIKGNNYNIEIKDEDTNNYDPYKVTISHDFYMDIYETTWDEFDRFNIQTTDDKPEKGLHPVTYMNFIHACEYANWLSNFHNLDKAYIINPELTNVEWNINANGYRLPTEAEWEYAAKGGHLNKELNFIFSGTNENPPIDYAWFSENDNGLVHEVGLKKPNQLGIYDMTGNVWEWCWDSWPKAIFHKMDLDSDSNSEIKDPIGPDIIIYKCIKGGCFCTFPEYMYTFSRSYADPELPYPTIGFRLVRNA